MYSKGVTLRSVVIALILIIPNTYSIFLSWLAKWLILRHGGLKAYRQAVPFFIGLILGEFIAGGLWSIIGIVFEMPVYRFWH